MRIIGGKYRGKKLWAPVGKDVRPTAERAREAVFNILYSHLNTEFGLEAISRGFKSVTFVDKDVTAVTRNAKMFPAEQEKINIIKADALNLPRLRRRFDMVFMDAPYAKGLTEQVLAQVVAKQWLAENAICIAEVRSDEKIVIPDTLELIDERLYGLARILFLREK